MTVYHMLEIELELARAENYYHGIKGQGDKQGASPYSRTETFLHKGQGLVTM